MRINKFVAHSSGLSRRAADTAIAEGKVTINNRPATLGDTVGPDDVVALNNKRLTASHESLTIMIDKPAGFVCSRNGQGSQTIYSLLPDNLHYLKPIGRLDKDSTGLLLLTNDGDLANQLTHPSFVKTKKYEITLDKPLQPLHQQLISDIGVRLEDGPSKLQLSKIDDNATHWEVTMHEGRNRQIRRTFAGLGYTVTALNRTVFGPYRLDQLVPTQRYLIIK